MTVVNFLCRREKSMMKKNAKIITAVLVLLIISLLIVLLHNQSSQEPPVPDTGPVSASLWLDRDRTPPTENKALVGEKTATVEPHNTHATEIDSEPPAHSNGAGISTPT